MLPGRRCVFRFLLKEAAAGPGVGIVPNKGMPDKVNPGVPGVGGDKKISRDSWRPIGEVASTMFGEIGAGGLNAPRQPLMQQPMLPPMPFKGEKATHNTIARIRAMGMR